MSYDIDLGDKAEFNITYNVSYMFYDVYPSSGIRLINEMKGEDGTRAIIHLRNNIEAKYTEFKAKEPKNGWGTVEHTLETLNKMILKSLEFPKEVWECD